MIELTKEQQNVHDSALKWFKESNKSHITIGGLAGTGKTTIIGFITKTIRSMYDNLPIAYVTYTGKASTVLKKKTTLKWDDYVGTIHSLIYKPIIDENGIIKGWKRRKEIDYSLIILDESSMVGKEIWEDLLSYGIPIIAVGDHGQLPPIGKENFSLMENPELKLIKIHRQALENPIIKLSLYARKHGEIPTKIFGKNAAKFDFYSDPKARDIINKYNIKEDSQILCGMNKTRVKLNNVIRNNNGFDTNEPLGGEKLICLKNNKNANIMNGQMGILQSSTIKTDFLMDLKIIMDDVNTYPFSLLSHRKAFGEINYDIVLRESYNKKILNGYDSCDEKPFVNVFDFGYAISVHKSQGSEYEKIILIEERNSYQTDDDYARWLYTGITRAREKLVIIENFY